MKFSTFIFTLLLTVTLINPVIAQDDDPPRTYYESLDLSSPEAAVTVFAEAFQREDFFTVFLVMHPIAQAQVWGNIRVGREPEAVYDTSNAEAVEAVRELIAASNGLSEHLPDSLSVFDGLMLVAAEHDALLIDLRGDIEILDSDETDVTATVEGIDGEVIFRMAQSVSGRWRVMQIIVPGGDEEQIPWSVP